MIWDDDISKWYTTWYIMMSYCDDIPQWYAIMIYHDATYVMIIYQRDWSWSYGFGIPLWCIIMIHLRDISQWYNITTTYQDHADLSSWYRIMTYHDDIQSNISLWCGRPWQDSRPGLQSHSTTHDDDTIHDTIWRNSRFKGIVLRFTIIQAWNP